MHDIWTSDPTHKFLVVYLGLILCDNSYQEESLNDALCNQLDQAIIEAETAKREAFEESMRRRKAEKDAIEAIRKVKFLARHSFVSFV